MDDGTSTNDTRLGAVCDLLFAMDKLHIDDDMLVVAADNLLFFSFQEFVDFAKGKQTSCIMCHEQPSIEKLQRTGVIVVDEQMKVLNMEVDTAHVNQFFGPKDVQDNPFLWSEWSLAFWLSVLMLVISVFGYYLYLRLRDNKPIISTIRIVKKLLPHQKAMKEIELIKAENMVNSENPKEYYTKLTDTLRKYIDERYGFRAMEMTSSEIIDRLMRTGDQQSLEELRQLFTTADLVKFAKYSTLINENDANLVSAIDFINQTKIENLPTEEVVKPELTEEQVRSKKMRTALKWIIWGITVLCISIFVYVVWHIYQLLM
jgi:sterol desaturase/sphingolipid hydroxylase (fatty acid hydroxylase superfamily)